jgi:hypothetical protein
MTDPRYDQRQSDPVTRRPEGSGGMWGWIAGAAVLVLVAIILIAGWNSNSHQTASNAPPAATTGSATAPAVKPPTTTGSAPATHPITPAKPAIPTKPGMQ